jgi:hypothetical protein
MTLQAATLDPLPPREFPGFAGAKALRGEQRIEVINGATCIESGSYLPDFSAFTKTYYLHIKNDGSAGNVSVFCHLTMSNEWPLSNLKNVFFILKSKDPVLVQLCIHAGNAIEQPQMQTCGVQKTLSPDIVQSSVEPPNPLPPYATTSYAAGAYVNFIIPKPNDTEIRVLYPFWSK